MIQVLKLTAVHSNKGEVFKEPVLIGIPSIITCEPVRSSQDYHKGIAKTKITSRHAMVTITLVTETIEEIYSMINGNK